VQTEIARFLAGKGLFDPEQDRLDFSLLSGGNSHVTWHARILATAVTAPTHELVIKVAQPDGPLAPYDVSYESDMTALAHRSGIPAPEVVGHCTEREAGAPFIAMRFVAGEVPSLHKLPQWLAGHDLDFRLRVGRELIRAIHRMRRLRLAEAKPTPLSARYTEVVTRAEMLLREAARNVLDVPPAIGFASHWLTSRFSELDAAPACLVHGDFRIGNAIFRDGALAAVLDWERAMIGHPLHDVAYLCLPGMRSGDRVSGLFTEAELAQIWAEETGEPLDIRMCSLFRIVSMYIEFANMLRVMARLAVGIGRLEGLRPLPLIARLHVDLLAAMRSWENGEFTL
jgi:aminoglycoside phosphotransferase (APT) family kinase protein